MKRTKRKNVRFTKAEWDTVCRKAERLKMKPATFIRNMALCDKWIKCDVEYICAIIQKVNRIGTELKMIIRVAENTNSEYLPKLYHLRELFEIYRGKILKHYAKLLN